MVAPQQQQQQLLVTCRRGCDASAAAGSRRVHARWGCICVAQDGGCEVPAAAARGDGPQGKNVIRHTLSVYEQTRKDDFSQVNRTVQCSLHLHALQSPTCGSYRIASCSPTLAPAATQTAAHSRLTLTLSSLAHDASVGFHAVNDAMNSPLGQFAMDLGGDIPGPIGTGFHVVSAADDLCVMRGCVACMPLLLCVAVVWQPTRLQVQR